MADCLQQVSRSSNYKRYVTSLEANANLAGKFIYKCFLSGVFVSVDLDIAVVTNAKVLTQTNV